ncbi:MAG TPA: VCBS repeat-containing protein, partial [Candidatus Paceibacterota bacterium]
MKKLVVIIFVVFGFMFLRNNVACGQITFEKFSCYPVSGVMTNHLATGDFNHDGKTDVAIATSYTENSTSINNSKLLLYLQDKDNLKIADNTYDYDGKTYGSVASIVCGDINHDGLDDIVIGVRNEVGIYYQNANGKFSLPVYLYAGTTVDAIKIGDADNDGFNDIVVSCADLGRIVVFFGDVSGKLSNANYYLSKKSGGGDVLQIAKLSSDTQNSVVKMYGQGLIGS